MPSGGRGGAGGHRAEPRDHPAPGPRGAALAPPRGDDGDVTADWTERLMRDGYLHLAGAVPRARVDAALRRINAWMGRGMPPAEMDRYTHQSACPDDRDHPVFTNLFVESSMADLVEEIFRPHGIAPVAHPQIALRFPTLTPGVPPPPAPHLDGIPTPRNGVPPGKIENFAALVGVYLRDVDAPWSGNFTVWPGSHHAHAAYFKTHGPRVLLAGVPDLDRGPPRQLTGRAGDAFLCHYLLAHGAAPNRSPNIRYAVFFRLRHAHHDALGVRPIMEPWLGWDGIEAPRITP